MIQKKYTVVELPLEGQPQLIELDAWSTFHEWEPAFIHLNQLVIQRTGYNAPRPQREQVMSVELPTSLLQLWIIYTPVSPQTSIHGE